MSAGMCYDARALPRKQKISKPRWKQWIELILNSGGKFGLSKACIVKHSGDIVASVVGLEINLQEFQDLHKALNCTNIDVVRVGGITYCVKSQNGKQMIAFNGGNYLIITRSKTLFIISICTCKNKLDLAAAWLQRIGDSID
ncbi:hypothetical protein SNE40_013847 [Patella caerulea]|uniref:Profilin n=1 Tax=Patella caerulea TaxID=87958 RepID=A0AAN8JH14_PATCE